MSRYAELEQLCASATDQEKLSILRFEVMTHLTAVEGFATLLSKRLDRQAIPNIPENYE